MPRLDCTSSSLPQRPTWRARPATFAGWGAGFLASLLVAVPGCREDPQSPSAVDSSPALASTAAVLAFFQLSAGETHSCGVTTANRAYCWGATDLGQLGDGSTTPNLKLTPVAVAGGLQFRQISAGNRSTCAVALSRRAYCWGLNFRGQLGDGTTTNRPKPTPVAGGHLFRMVETGAGHTCGVSYPDDRVYCWGWNSDGQLGDGTRTDRHLPVAVAGTLDFRQVTVGWRHTCGATKDTRAFCWGDGRYGQLGNGAQAVAFAPKAVAGGLHFTRVSAGYFYTCAESGADVAYCWGNLFEEGAGFTVHAVPSAVAGTLSFAQVSAGGSHACGKTPASVAYCWGGNFSGELGSGSTIPSSTPEPVVGTM